MALETNYPKSKAPKEPQAKDKLPEPTKTTPEETGNEGYGTTDGVKEGDQQFEQVLVDKKPASNVDEESGKKK